MEHCAEIISYGYMVTFDFTIPALDVLVDISGMRRLFDNLFSNIMKYAEKKASIEVTARVEGDIIRIEVSNTIMENAKKVESTRIGLKTCEKICTDVNGSFSYEEENNVFTARIALPAEPRLDEAEENDCAADETVSEKEDE